MHGSSFSTPNPRGRDLGVEVRVDLRIAKAPLLEGLLGLRIQITVRRYGEHMIVSCGCGVFIVPPSPLLREGRVD